LIFSDNLYQIRKFSLNKKKILRKINAASTQISILDGKNFQQILGQILGIFFKNSRGRGLTV
jgi:hypothetical protein